MIMRFIASEKMPEGNVKNNLVIPFVVELKGVQAFLVVYTGQTFLSDVSKEFKEEELKR